MRKSPRRVSTWMNLCPSRTGRRPMRTVSTSGNSGTAQPLRVAADDGSPAESARAILPAMTADTTASFGFRDVPEAEKEGLVREVFSSVAGKL